MWVLEKLRSIILRSDASPQVIVTDRDVALMNAVEKVFPDATQFVDAWINKVMRLSTTTTNRVESSHSRLKNILQDSRGDLCNCWDGMNNMITLQHTEIKASFQRSITIVEHSFNNPLYNELRGLLPRNALALIDDEKQHINYVGIDSSACDCTLRNKYGLPCACQQPDQFPSTLHPFIVKVDDVEADGNCGYRAIATSLGFGQDSWPVTRGDLSRELLNYHAQYIKLFGGVDRYNQLRMSLFIDCGKIVSVNKWMTLPDMGYIIASRY
ncbi:Protein FAR1-RELATED SEQUENCE 11 [Sesbania bispinosa]|nr:Protein FAR1-RELATED SEQUENCE 11 [Sesbania bispinosa]